jgi:acyl carrier protein
MNEKLLTLVADCLELERSKISERSSIHNCDKWDSLRQMRIILKLEETYNIEIDEEEAMELTSIEEIQDYLNDL